MSGDEFIPTGRTALVGSGPGAVQVQTEYAPNPTPRITTTVSKQGRVLHKVEMKLKRHLASTEERKRAEAYLTRQHGEVISIIKDQKVPLGTRPEPSAPIEMPVKPEPVAERSLVPEVIRQSESGEAILPSGDAERFLRSTAERIREIPGVEYVFHLDNAGNFFGRRQETQFRRQFRKLARNIRDLVEVFAEIPGSGFQREAGVYEVEHDRLYVASTGEEFFFITVTPVDARTDYETAIKQVVAGR